MTILDRDVTTKSKEDNVQSRQTSGDIGNRKQRSRTGHAVRDRTPCHNRTGQVGPNVSSFSYWADATVTHRNPKPESHFDSDSARLQLQREDLNIREHIKPRGLSKSNATVAPSGEPQNLISESVNRPIDNARQLSASPILSQSSDLTLPSSSYSMKNLGRLGKKNNEKKISHKKKHRRGMPYNQNGKSGKCHASKINVPTHRVKVSHPKPQECVQSASESSTTVSRPYVSGTILTTDGQFVVNESNKRYTPSPDFVRAGTLAHSDHYANLSIASKSSRKSPNMLDGEHRTLDRNSYEKDVALKEVNEAKHNSDDEYDQGRLQQLNRNVDFKKLERDFEENLKKVRGFIIKPMGEDGACLFRAVADQVYGDQNMHDEVRKNCMSYMKKNSDYYSNYVTEDFKAYIDRKSDPHTFGNHLEIQAMAEIYNRPFEVYQYTTKPINTFHTSHPCANPPIRLSYHENSHYNSVVDPYEATIGVGLGLPSFHPGLVDKSMLNDALKASCEVWEQQMLNDKVQATDWESTDDVIIEQVVRESYMEYMEQKSSELQEVKPQSTEGKKSPTRESDSNKKCPKSETPKIVKEFPKKTNRVSNATGSDWVAEENEWQVLSQVLANSQQEYMDALKHQAAHSKATCSKYT